MARVCRGRSSSEGISPLAVSGEYEDGPLTPRAESGSCHQGIGTARVQPEEADRRHRVSENRGEGAAARVQNTSTMWPARMATCSSSRDIRWRGSCVVYLEHNRRIKRGGWRRRGNRRWTRRRDGLLGLAATALVPLGVGSDTKRHLESPLNQPCGGLRRARQAITSRMPMPLPLPLPDSTPPGPSSVGWSAVRSLSGDRARRQSACELVHRPNPRCTTIPSRYAMRSPSGDHGRVECLRWEATSSGSRYGQEPLEGVLPRLDSDRVKAYQHPSG
jgi:hypothetical protein